MLSNYFKIASRNLRKNKVSTFINTFGLAIGLTCCMLIAAYIRDETSYDRYPVQADNIYRVNLNMRGNSAATYPSVDVAVGPGMKANFPEIKEYTRVEHFGGVFVEHGTRQFKELNMAVVDSNFFQVFTLPFLEGDARTALSQPNTLVITKAFATKYFGEGPALGQTLHMAEYGVYKVSGVIDKIPDNAHFHFDAFLPLRTEHFKELSWSNIGFYTYLLLDPKTDPRRLEKLFPQLVKKYVVPEVARDMGVPMAQAQDAVNTVVFSLVPVRDIHLHSDTKYELEANSDFQYLYIFGALALFILLLACVNFTNLSTAGSAKRGKEVGIRKVLGTLRGQLIAQFLTESILLTLGALLVALGLVALLLPWFNQVSGKHISFMLFLHPQYLLMALVLVLVVGATAGIYPAFFMSSFNTIKVLKGAAVLQGGRKSLLRSSLVVFQFFVSIALIVATLVVYRQLHFMQDKRLGYDKDQVLYLQDTRLLGNNQEAFKQQLLQDKHVLRASISWCVPGSGAMNGTEIYPKNDGPGNGREIHANIFNIDYDYVPTLGLKIIRGRNFSRDFPADTPGVIINEAAVRDLGWANTDPIGKIIVRSGRHEFRVVGVVEDFNYVSVKQKIAALMLLMGNNSGGMIVKINTADVKGFLSDTKKKWDAFSPAGPFGYYFLDDQYAHMYMAEQRTGSLFTSFTILAIVIAGLGLFGLAVFIVEQRTREIGIRKVLGATVGQVLILVSKEFVVLVGIAFLIAAPVTYWGMRVWLENFAYRTPFNWWILPVAGIMALLLALLTISFQTVKAAITSPIESLKRE